MSGLDRFNRELGGKSSGTGSTSLDRAMLLQGEGDSCVTAADKYLATHGSGSDFEAKLRLKATKRFAAASALLDSGTEKACSLGSLSPSGILL